MQGQALAPMGLMGDKVLTISPGTSDKSPVNNGDIILTKNAIEMEDVMLSAKTSVDNAGIITAQLAEFTTKMNTGNGALSKLISDEKFSNSLQSTLVNLQTASHEFALFTAKINSGGLSESLDTTMRNIQGATKGLNENMEAAKSNILLKGFFNKKKKADAKKAAELKKEEDKRKKQQLKITADSIKNATLIIPVKKDTRWFISLVEISYNLFLKCVNHVIYFKNCVTLLPEGVFNFA
jgi:phospholipid/cholesterol/gamma-HCH transport system substrate-binding protein